ncbi:MAG TPA: restriction endonuclease [Rhizomicrobium sp.]|jgi:hypothetical protein|nr:restriction endonuclease [Rhizomicrobium sp.]
MASDATSSLMSAIERFEAVEANILKLERLWSELQDLVPRQIAFGASPEYEDRCRSYSAVLASIPKIDGWKPAAEPQNLDDIAQNRLDAHELNEPSAHASVENWIEAPGRELREYRFRFNNKRRALIRDALTSLLDQVDADLRLLRKEANAFEEPHRLDDDLWSDLRLHIRQINTLLGSSVQKPPRWSDLLRHMHFGYIHDLADIEETDWPNVKNGLRKSMYGVNDPLPVDVEDLSDLVAAKPTGTVASELAWKKLVDNDFERLVFSLIGNAKGYENPEWLMQTRAPDRGRDLSVWRVSKDDLAGTSRRRVVIQCKHWQTRSVTVQDAATAKDQMALWSDPRVDVLVIATSGRFTADAVAWIEKHNASGVSPSIEMWPESHLETLLAARPALIAEFGLR